MDIYELIGDQPVSEQISLAIQNHEHQDYPTRAEFDALVQEVRAIRELIGDSPVSEQINNILQEWR